MASPELDPQVTIAPLLPGATSIDQKTITLWLQIAFGTGYYTVGGVPSGLAAYAGSLTVNDTQFLWADIKSEDAVTTSLNQGGYTYRYVPATDLIQIFDGAQAAGNELTSSQVIPAGVLNDTIVAQITYNRLSA